jgi:hypothetical protein
MEIDDEIDIPIMHPRAEQPVMRPIILDEKTLAIERELQDELQQINVDEHRSSSSCNDGDINMDSSETRGRTMKSGNGSEIPTINLSEPDESPLDDDITMMGTSDLRASTGIPVSSASSNNPNSNPLSHSAGESLPMVRSAPLPRRVKPKRAIPKSVKIVSEDVANDLLSSFTNRPLPVNPRVPSLKEDACLPADLMKVEVDEMAKNHPSFTEPTAIAAVKLAKELDEDRSTDSSSSNQSIDNREKNRQIIRMAIRKITQPKVTDFRKFLTLIPIEDRFSTCNKKKAAEAAEADIPVVGLAFLRSQLRSPIIANGERKCMNENNCVAVTKAHAREPLMVFQILKVQSELKRQKKELGILPPNVAEAIYRLNPYHLPFCALCLEYDTLILHATKLGIKVSKGTAGSDVNVTSTTTSSSSPTSSSSSSSASSSSPQATNMATESNDHSGIDDVFVECYQTFQVLVDIAGEYDSKHCIPLSKRRRGVYAMMPVFDEENFTFLMHDVDGVRVPGLAESDALVHKPQYPPKTLSNF